MEKKNSSKKNKRGKKQENLRKQLIPQCNDKERRKNTEENRKKR